MANIIRWDDPFSGLTSLHSQLDNMFNNLIPSSQTRSMAMPSMDVYNEDDKSLVVEVQAPGYDKDDISVDVQNGVLEIRGEKHEKQEDKGKQRNYMVRESHGSFYRRLALPENVDEDSVAANFDNGVLSISLPYKELPQAKKITISAGKGNTNNTGNKKK